MVDLLGVGLLVTGLALIVAELTWPGYYVGVAGTVGVVMGLMQMVWNDFLTAPSSALIAALVAVVAAIISFQFYRKFGSPIDQRGGTPSEALVGKDGIVRQTILPHELVGRVEVDGRLWGADAHEPIEKGAAIIVEAVHDTHVMVRRATGSSSPE